MTLKFDGHDAVHETLDNGSRGKTGQVVTFPKHTFAKVEVDISQVHQEHGGPINPVGFVEVRMSDDAPGAPRVSRVSESTRVPEDLLDAMGTASLANPLTFSFSTRPDGRPGVAPPVHAADRAFVHRVGNRGDRRARRRRVRRQGGRPAVGNCGRHHRDLARALRRSARTRSSAIDGDPSTAWNTPLGAGRGYIQLKLPQAKTFDHLNLRLVDDGRHSLPTRVRIESEEDGSRRNIDLRPLPHHDNGDGTVSIPVTFDAIHGKKITFTILDMRPRVLRTSSKQKGVLLPSAVAELGLPGVQRQAIPANMPTTCHNDLLTVDGKPFPVRVIGHDGRRAPAAPAHGDAVRQATDRLARGGNAHHRRGGDAELQEWHRHRASALRVGRGREGDGTRVLADADAARPSGSEPSITVVHQGKTSMTVARERGVEAVLVGARREPQQRLGRQSRRPRSRAAEPRRRLRERLARATGQVG